MEEKIIVWTHYREIKIYQRQGENSKIQTVNMKCFLGSLLKRLNRSNFCSKEMVKHEKARLTDIIIIAKYWKY